MVEIREISEIGDERLDLFARLTDNQLRYSQEYKEGIFICESPKVIRVALANGWQPVSMLCERKHITGDAADIVEKLGALPYLIPIFTGTREMLSSLTGYVLTRGVLCAMKRKLLPELSEICRESKLVAVLQSITDTTNIGSIFRAASGLGVDAVVLSSDTCDPLNRRAVRVSMGNVFNVPWTTVPNPVTDLKKLGFTTLALALKEDSVTLDDPKLKAIERKAVIFGTEGDGLPDDIIAATEYTVIIPMHHGTDSLNVASAAAVTFWELGKNGRSR